MVITFVEEEYEFSIDIHSHFTTILGIESGEGKSWLFDTVSRRYEEGVLKIICDKEVKFSDSSRILDDIQNNDNCILFVDEISINKNNQYMRIINESVCPIVLISRAVVQSVFSPLDGIYQIEAKSIGFGVHPIEGIRLWDGSDVDIIVTESEMNKSEHAFLSAWLDVPDVLYINACGKDKIQHIVNQYADKRVLTFTDLGNISSQYKLLRKRCSDNKNLYFYDYQSFEHLLCESLIVSENLVDLDVLDYKSVEAYYEALIEESTKGTKYSFIHDKPVLSTCYTQECDGCTDCVGCTTNKLKALLDSDCGRQLLRYIVNKHKSETRNCLTECLN